MDILQLDPDKLAFFRDAHEKRRAALFLRSQEMLDWAAEMYEALDCPVNAEMTRRSLARLTQINYVESDRRR